VFAMSDNLCSPELQQSAFREHKKAAPESGAA
jgi:hypothetical protein